MTEGQLTKCNFVDGSSAGAVLCSVIVGCRGDVHRTDPPVKLSRPSISGG